MHHALLIDEVLQLIFDHCVALPKSEPRWTLCQLARCCKAWKDPALDRLWSRIDGMAPLVSLLQRDEQGTTDNASVSPAFHAYAARVKAISHPARFSIPGVDELATVMPRLEAVTLSFHGCMVPSAWILSDRLRRIAINIGPARDPQTVIDRSNAAASYLEQATLCAPDLQTLHIRGRMTESLNRAVAGLTQLRSLTIYANCFLTCDTLAAVATFPRLRSLAIHASGISHADFADALSRSGAPCFPALEDLEIRAGGSLLATVIEHMPARVLTKLRAEVDRSPRGPGYLKGVFEMLSHKMSESMSELLIEDLTEFEDLDTSLRPHVSPEWYPLSLLAPLAGLKDLRQFAIVSMLAPALTDADLERMGKWWPALQHLNLGTFDVDYLPPDWPVQMTPAALPAVAKFLPHLESLALPILPIDLVAATGMPPTSEAVVPQQKALRSMTIGDVPDAAACASALVKALLATFPSLSTVECPAHEVTERFAAVQLC